MLFPDTPLDAAADTAERLRAEVAATSIELVDHITISLGVADWRNGG